MNHTKLLAFLCPLLLVLVGCLVGCKGEDTVFIYENEEYNFYFEFDEQLAEKMIVKEEVEVVKISEKDENQITLNFWHSSEARARFVFFSLVIFDKSLVSNDLEASENSSNLRYLDQSDEYYFYTYPLYDPVFRPFASSLAMLFHAENRAAIEHIESSFKTNTEISYYDGTNKVIVPQYGTND